MGFAEWSNQKHGKSQQQKKTFREAVNGTASAKQPIIAPTAPDVDQQTQRADRDAFDSRVRKLYEQRKAQERPQESPVQRPGWDANNMDIAAKNQSGRLSGHGMNVDAETFRKAQATDEDRSRHFNAGVASIGHGLLGSVPAITETLQQWYKNHQNDLQNAEWQKQNAELKLRGKGLYRGRLEMEAGIRQPGWDDFEAQLKRREEASDNTPVDQSLFGQRHMARQRELQAYATEDLSGFGKFLANTGISIGANLPGIGVGILNPAAGLGIMGVQATAQKAAELNARGIAPDESFVRSAISGTIETATEKIPLHNLVDIIKAGGGKSFVKTLMRQSGIEATEESAAYVLNFVADEAAADPTSQWSWMELLQAAGAGAISGGVFATGGFALNNALGNASAPQYNDIKFSQALPSALPGATAESIIPKLAELGAPSPLAQKQAEIIAAIVNNNRPISGNEAATIATSPQAIQVLTELTGQAINTNAPISEVKGAIRALPAPQATRLQEEGNFTQRPENVPTAQQEAPRTAYPKEAIRSAAATLGKNGQKAMSVAYDGTIAPDVFFPAFAQHYNAGLNGKPQPALSDAITKDQAFAAFSSGTNDAATSAQNQTGNQTQNQTGKPNNNQTGTKPEPARNQNGSEVVPEKQDAHAYAQTLPKKASTLFHKWAANEYVNIDLSDNSRQDEIKAYINYFDKWFNAGKAGTRSIDVKREESDFDFPPFLEEVIYRAGKEAAVAEAKKAEKKGASSNGSEKTDNRPAMGEPSVSGEVGRGTVEEVEPEDVPGSRGSGDAVSNAGNAGELNSGSTARTDAGRHVGGRSVGDREGADIPSAGEVIPQNSAEAEQETIESAADEKAEQTVTENPKGNNHLIGDSLNLPSGDVARFNANIAAIKTVKQLMEEGRYATADEQAILSKYVGWGGLADAFDNRKEAWSKRYNELKELLTDEEYKQARASTLNAHYTSVEVIRAMYEGLKHLGFNGGSMLEPSCGVGHFSGAMPPDMSNKVRKWTMVELDSITGHIAKYLYPNSDVRVQGFEKTNLPNDYFDVAIGNVPFGNFAIVDKAYPNTVTSAIHNYFFAKSLDKVRPGGIVLFITSRFTLDAANSKVREYMADRADLLGAIRLPDTAFKGNAGTEVVTDILVLRRRAAKQPYAGEDFTSTLPLYVSGKYAGSSNVYFTLHPEMILGEASLTGSMYSSDSLTYTPLPGDLNDHIVSAFKKITGKMDYPATPTKESTNLSSAEHGKKAKNGSFVAKNGEVFVQQDGELIKQELNEKAKERVLKILPIRDAARELLNAQTMGNATKKLRGELNKLYDAYIAEYDFLCSQGNVRIMSKDPDWAFISSLENYDKETKTATKADIFFKDTVQANTTVDTVDTVADGLVVSINETGSVDLSRISSLTGITQEESAKQLMSAGLIFKTRTGNYETAEQYLSGNVKAKLQDAEALALVDEDYKTNVEELSKIIPEDVPYQSIHATIGATWIPTEVYEIFGAKMTGCYYNQRNKPVKITYNAALGQYSVVGNNDAKRSVENMEEWGTRDRTFLKIFDAVLNKRSLTVRRKTEDGTYYVDKQATIAANEKAEAIKAEFSNWLWEHEPRREALAKLYNDMFNNTVTPKYDGADLTVNGINSAKPLRPHQQDAIKRIIMSGGNTLIAHEVGAGKTAEMAAAAMKLRQLGIVKKPMFIVPKSLVAQWGREFLDFFPSAKLLVAGEHDTEKKNRRTFANRIATGDYDAVILSYENFKAIPVSSDTQIEFLSEQIMELEEAIDAAVQAGNRRDPSVKQMEKAKKNLESKIAKLGEMKKDEDNIDFESLGVDSLFVDEAHNYKNLFYTTNMTNVSGLGDKNGSQRSFDLYMKVRYLQQLNSGRGIVFATATPVMNSMSEMYIMQKYLQYDLLKQRGLTSFDAWASQFGETCTVLEIKPSGKGFRQKESFSRFKNIPELMQMFHSFADVLTDIPGLKIPKANRQTIIAKPSEFVLDYIDKLEERAEAVSKRGVDPSEDNMLKITSDGRKASYTQRMIDPALPYEDGSKISMCADKTFEIWKETKKAKSTQLIFCDMATPKGENKAKPSEAPEGEELTGEETENVSLYHDIKKMLMLKGIPEKEIAFIHDADTQTKKAKLFDDVNVGRVRVLIGSTGKMGVGMNAQKKIIALHHLDSPWRPGDVKQQEGRALRQGNENDEVYIYTYVTESTFDARMWDGLERKAKFINAVMTGRSDAREIEDVGEQALTFAEIKALASGNPLIQEQVEVSNEIQKLSALKSEHAKSTQIAHVKLKKAIASVSSGEQIVAAIKKDLTKREDVTGDNFTLTVGKKAYTDRAKAGEAIIKEAKRIAKDENASGAIGSFAGFQIEVNGKGDMFLAGNINYPASLNLESPSGTVQSLEVIVRGLETRLANRQKLLDQDRADITKLNDLIASPFPKQERLSRLLSRNNEIMQILNPREDAVGAADESDDDDYDDLIVDEGEVDRMESTAGTASAWEAERVGGNKSTMRLSDIIGKIRHDFDVSITTGHIRSKKTLGQYNNKNQGIRAKISNDLPTVAHELGHHFDNTYGITKQLDPILKKELIDMLPAGMKASYKEAKWKKEGLAEFMRLYLQNRETAAIDYPAFTVYFRHLLTEKDRKLLDELADEVNAYYSLDATTAESSIRFREEGARDFRGVTEKLKDLNDVFYQRWVDANHGISLYDKATGANTYKLASNSSYADCIAHSLLVNDLTDMHGKRVGDGLEKVLSGINLKDKNEYRAFGEYLVVKHGPERLAEGMRVFADERKNSTNWMNNRRTELEQQYPEFQSVSEKLYAFQTDFLDTWGVKTGLVSPESVVEWKDRWEYYVPFNRSIDKDGTARHSKKGYANQTSTIKRAKGSGLDIVHPVDNIINNMVMMVNAGLKNNVMVEITKAAKKNDGTATFLEQVPTPMKPKTFDSTKLKDKIRQSTVEAGFSKADEDKVFDIVAGIEDILIQYGRGQAHGDVVTVLKNGTPEFWKINDALLLSSITSMTPQRLPVWLELYGEISKFMTVNLTGINVVWSIFSNMPRDIMTYITYSTDRNPLKIFSGIGYAYLNKLRPNRNDPLYKEYLAMGGGKTSVYTADIDLAKRVRRKLSESKLHWLNPIEWVEFIADTVELGPRFSYYRILRQKGLSAEEAFFGSTDITVNFRRGGVDGRSLNKIIPFFGASVQGVDKYCRWQSGADAPAGKRKQVVFGRAAGMMAVSLAIASLLWWLNSGDDDERKQYAQLSNYTKNNFWCFPLGDGEYFTIPKPRELGAMSTLFEASMEYFDGGNKYAFDDMGDYLSEMMLPNVVSDIAKGDIPGAIGSLGIVGVGACMIANRDFMGRPIVSESMKQLEPKDQFTDRTSKLAYWMGQAFNTSPQMLDYFFQQTLGGFWKSQKALFPVGNANRDFTLGVANTYVRDSMYSTDLINRLYEGRDKAEKAKNSNPKDTAAAIEAKLYSNMATFYSRYNKLSKADTKSRTARETRQIVLDMVDSFLKTMDGGERNMSEKNLERFCDGVGSTEFMPSVMDSTIKVDKREVELSASEYVQFQADYLSLYWRYVPPAISSGGAKPETATRRAKKNAADEAKQRAFSKHGMP